MQSIHSDPFSTPKKRVREEVDPSPTTRAQEVIKKVFKGTEIHSPEAKKYPVKEGKVLFTPNGKERAEQRGIYLFLSDEGEAYVGYSGKLKNRISSHKNPKTEIGKLFQEKKILSYRILFSTEDPSVRLDDLEKIAIEKLQLKTKGLNKTKGGNGGRDKPPLGSPFRPPQVEKGILSKGVKQNEATLNFKLPEEMKKALKENKDLNWIYAISWEDKKRIYIGGSGKPELRKNSHAYAARQASEEEQEGLYHAMSQGGCSFHLLQAVSISKRSKAEEWWRTFFEKEGFETFNLNRCGGGSYPHIKKS